MRARCPSCAAWIHILLAVLARRTACATSFSLIVCDPSLLSPFQPPLYLLMCSGFLELAILVFSPWIPLLSLLIDANKFDSLPCFLPIFIASAAASTAFVGLLVSTVWNCRTLLLPPRLSVLPPSSAATTTLAASTTSLLFLSVSINSVAHSEGLLLFIEIPFSPPSESVLLETVDPLSPILSLHGVASLPMRARAPSPSIFLSTPSLRSNQLKNPSL
mmetsp:Transcript_14442/g.17853  ORF Transcript_14442/g.17853 Transcript_14442/m.17853 type:complete len:218 (-) Transcript_14442:133-786(-)